MSTKQLYEKTSEGMKEVNPLVAIEDIYSKLSDTPLEALVSLYNHVKCEWKGSVADTRRTVPLFLRRSGLFITYNNGTKYVTEFFSAGTNQITTEGWVKDSNWTSVPDEDYISAGVKPGVGSIGYEQLNDNLKQLFREKVNVTNYPDDEDIVSVDNMLKLKDREVDAANFQSKGYIILRKNLCLVNGVVKNILTQSMINQPNTIYDIRYDFDLNGTTIEIPNNCILNFKGGSLNNGIINENYTEIVANDDIIFKNIKLIGTSKTKEFKCIWFGIVANIDVTDIINDATLNIKNVGGGALLFKSGTYKIHDSILIRDNVSMIGQEHHNNAYYRNDTIFEGFVKDTSYYWMFDTDILDKETGTRRPYNYFYNVLIANDANNKNKQIFIKNITLYSFCSDSKNSEIYGGLRLLHCVNVTLDNICVANTKVGMYISSTWNTSIGRLELNTNLYGAVFGIECTNVNINVLSCVRRSPDYKYSNKDLFDSVYLVNQYMTDKYLTGGIISYNANIQINNADIEGWDYIGYMIATIININLIYYENIKNYLFYFRTAIVNINNQCGAQFVNSRKLLNKALYFDSRGSSYVKLCGEYYGDNSFDVGDTESKLIIGNTYPFKHGAYYPINYDNNSNNVYYDFPSNYIFVSNDGDNKNLGFSKYNPITFKEAINRIGSDNSYKNKTIYLLSDVTSDCYIYNDINILCNNHNILSYSYIVGATVTLTNLNVSTTNTIISIRSNSTLKLDNPNISNRFISIDGYGNSLLINGDNLNDLRINDLFYNTYTNQRQGDIAVYVNNSRKNLNKIKKEQVPSIDNKSLYQRGDIVYDEYDNAYIWDGEKLSNYISRPYNNMGSPNQRPSNVFPGTMFKNTATNKWEIFNGTNWENIDGTESA
nr:MAG TPA: Pectate lyase [Crassvirales sp.]